MRDDERQRFLRYEKDTGSLDRIAAILSGFGKNVFIPAILLLCLFIPLTVSADEQIKIGGTGCAIGSMRMLADAFEKLHPGQKIRILASLGSSGGIKAVSKNAIDIAVSSRPPKDKEKQCALTVTEYARTPLVFVTRSDVKISGLTTDEIIKIYGGETKTWPGGARIRIILRPAGESDTIMVKNISPAMDRAIVLAASRPGMVTALTDQENLNILEKTPGAFGTSTLTQVISEKRAVKVLSYNGVFPSAENIKNGAYPVVKPLFIITAKTVSPLIRNFLEYLRSPEGKKMLEKTGNLAVD